MHTNRERGSIVNGKVVIILSFFPLLLRPIFARGEGEGGRGTRLQSVSVSPLCQTLP
jgi:hypothetical protein